MSGQQRWFGMSLAEHAEAQEAVDRAFHDLAKSGRRHAESIDRQICEIGLSGDMLPYRMAMLGMEAANMRKHKDRKDEDALEMPWADPYLRGTDDAILCIKQTAPINHAMEAEIRDILSFITCASMLYRDEMGQAAWEAYSSALLDGGWAHGEKAADMLAFLEFARTHILPPTLWAFDEPSLKMLVQSLQSRRPLLALSLEQRHRRMVCMMPAVAPDPPACCISDHAEAMDRANVIGLPQAIMSVGAHVSSVLLDQAYACIKEHDGWREGEPMRTRMTVMLMEGVCGHPIAIQKADGVIILYDPDKMNT